MHSYNRLIQPLLPKGIKEPLDMARWGISWDCPVCRFRYQHRDQGWL